MKYVLYNPLANNGTGVEMKNNALPEIKDFFGEVKELSVLDLKIEDFIVNLTKEDVLILVGGDGSLYHMANAIYGRGLENKFYLYKAGTGNDFLRDILDENSQEKLIDITKYLKKLPKVTINNTTTRFINGVGFGIDGMVCEVADELKAKGKKKLNYTMIAIKLLLFKYKCPDALVYLDGKEYNFKKVWIASAMNGRFYGGGMMATPKQDRNSGKLTFSLFYGSNKIKTLMIFAKIFTGEHLNYPKHCINIEAKKIEVRFSRPTSLQIDGETHLNVTSYVAEID